MGSWGSAPEKSSSAHTIPKERWQFTRASPLACPSSSTAFGKFRLSNAKLNASNSALISVAKTCSGRPGTPDQILRPGQHHIANHAVAFRGVGPVRTCTEAISRSGASTREPPAQPGTDALENFTLSQHLTHLVKILDTPIGEPVDGDLAPRGGCALPQTVQRGMLVPAPH